jgi:transcription elongation factor GreA
MLEARISKLKNKLANARLIDDSEIDDSKVFILSTVKIKNIKNSMEMTYTLVAENEADIRAGKISVDSPIGKGLLGKEVGQIADISTPAGIMKFEIVSIQR